MRRTVKLRRIILLFGAAATVILCSGCEEIVYPDEIHDLLLWRSWIDAYRATAAFFAREL